MFLDAYHQTDGETVQISAAQGSRFAKEVAGDYNPIHDADSRRFCVPGDLLFALVLARYGLSARMDFEFRGMLGGGVPVHFPAAPGPAFDIADDAGKVYLHVERDGERAHDPARIEAFVRRYVSFSGRNFPHYLLPLMAEHGVMFNPDRPLVIYDSMGFTLESAAVAEPGMSLTGSGLDVQGKRAEARLAFGIDDGGRPIGEGAKKLIVSGLRPYEEAAMDAFVAEFEARITRR
ncbi:DUF3581 domain-containing protein [Ectothiorhodospiraceae bacterium WFHF3C12]|nr:DUF3581 domain-containing protein [Ectothiorhodospiraceae bacterium WFHF3C12]